MIEPAETPRPICHASLFHPTKPERRARPGNSQGVCLPRALMLDIVRLRDLQHTAC
jgi:hypothetical protein